MWESDVGCVSADKPLHLWLRVLLCVTGVISLYFIKRGAHATARARAAGIVTTMLALVWWTCVSQPPASPIWKDLRSSRASQPLSERHGHKTPVGPREPPPSAPLHFAMSESCSPLWAARTWAALPPELEILGPPCPRAERQSHLGTRRAQQRRSQEAGPLSTWMRLCLKARLLLDRPLTTASKFLLS